jgi:prophage regulatory protein
MQAELNRARTGSRTSEGVRSGLRILRFPDVVSKTGLSKSAIYERIRSAEFPAPVALGPRAVGFVSHEIDRWLSNVIEASRKRSMSAQRVGQ